MRVTLIAVTHRSAGVLPAAVETFRAAALGAGVEPQVLVVDHSEDAAEADRLRACLPDRLLVRPNRGFAAGINAGLEAAEGDVVLLANPDLRFRPGSVAELVAALDGGWDVVGPQFDLAGFLFPPADEQTPAETLRRGWAGRSLTPWTRRLLAEAGRWRRVWEAAEPVRMPMLSGALLAMRAATARRLGPMDEGYFLYFEETDWLRRAAAAKLAVAVVPTARVEHRWGHAAVPASSADLYARSRRRFMRRHHRWTAPAADRLAGRLSRGFEPRPVGGVPAESPTPGRELDWLVSPSPRLLPSAGIRSAAPPRAAYAAFRAVAPAADVYAAALARESARVYGPWRV